MLCLQIYNDAMAEMMTSSGSRFIPMTLMPAWSVDLSVEETRRAAGLGLHGINMTSDPQDAGSPDLADRAWDPLWKVCSELNMPVHFHIGSSNTAIELLRQLLLGVTRRVSQAGHQWGNAVPQQRPRRHEHDLLRRIRPLPGSHHGRRRERHRLDTVHPRDDGLRAGRNAPNHFKAMKHKPSEYFAKMVCHLLVRRRPWPVAEPHGHRP